MTTDYNTWMDRETAAYRDALERAMTFACTRLSLSKFENRKYKANELLAIVQGQSQSQSALPKGLTAQKWKTIQDVHRAREEDEKVNVYTAKTCDSVPKGFVSNGVFCGKDREIVDWCAANITDATTETEMEVSVHKHEAPADSETIEIGNAEESDDPIVKKINKELENSDSDDESLPTVPKKSLTVDTEESEKAEADDDMPVKKPAKKQAKKTDSDDTDDDMPAKKADSDDEASDDMPAKKPAKKQAKKADSDDEASDDMPAKKPTKKQVKKADSDDEASDDMPAKKPTKKQVKKADSDDEASDDMPAKKPTKKQAKKADSDDEASDDMPAKKPTKKQAKKADSDDESESVVDDDDAPTKYPKGYSADKYKKLKAAIGKRKKGDYVNTKSNRVIKESDATKKKFVFLKDKGVCVPKEDKVILEWIKKNL